jgi:excisionase family DNA binding protein
VGAAEVIVVTPDQLRALIREEVERAVASRPAPSPVVPVPAGYLKVSAAADRYSVAPETIRAWIAAGKLPRHRAGRHWLIRPDEVEALIARGGTTAPGEVDPAALVGGILRRVRR